MSLNSILLFKIMLETNTAVSEAIYLVPILLKFETNSLRLFVLSLGGLSPKIPPMIKASNSF